MRKLFTFLLAATFVALSNLGVVNAQEYFKNPLFVQDFEGLDALPEGWAGITGNSALFGRAGTLTVADGAINITGAGTNSGNRGYEISFPSTASNPEMAAEATSWFVEVDWTIDASTNIGNKNAMALIFYGPNSTNITAPETAEEQPYLDLIFGLYMAGPSGFVHYWNQDLIGTVPDTSEGAEEGATVDIGPAFVSGQYPGFWRAGASVDDCLVNNAATQTSVAFELGKTYRIVAELDFSTKRVKSLTITDKAIPENTQTITDMPFISNQVTELSNVAVVNTRATGRGIGNGGNAPINSKIDNMELYYMKLSLGRANVTINYLDQEGAVAKAPRVDLQQEVGLLYSASVADKTWFTDDNFYYAYDALMTGEASKAVVPDPNNEGLNFINIFFKKTPKAGAPLVWTGATDGTWDQISENFSIDGGTTNIAYQQTMGVEFSSEDAENKDIILNEVINLGDNEMKVTASQYNFSGTGRIEGTGTMSISKRATLNIDNRLEAGVEFAGDTLTILNDAAGATFAMASASVLETKTAFSKPITGQGALTLYPSANGNVTSAITGVSELTLALNRKGGMSGYTYTSSVPRIYTSFTDGGTIKAVSTINDTVFYGMTVNQANAKIDLGDNVFMVFADAPARPDNDGFTAIEIGALSGTSSSGIGSHRVGKRRVEYTIGSLGTDAEFAGRIIQWDDQTNEDGTPINTLYTNFTKVGAGKWRLSGDSPDYYGSFTVNEGILEIAGEIGTNSNNVAIVVEEGATLKGDNGSLGSTDLSIYGTLEGGINLTNEIGSLQVTGESAKVKMNVNSFNEGRYDVTSISGTATFDADLEITVSEYKPNEVTTIKLFDLVNGADMPFNAIYVNGEDITANTNDGSVDHFVWDNVEMTLTYYNNPAVTNPEDPGLGIDSEIVKKDIANIQYYDLSGRAIAKDSAEGFVIMKITYVDGTTANQKAYIIKK